MMSVVFVSIKHIGDMHKRIGLYTSVSVSQCTAMGHKANIVNAKKIDLKFIDWKVWRSSDRINENNLDQAIFVH